jgi:hypothetical protein
MPYSDRSVPENFGIDSYWKSSIEYSRSRNQKVSWGGGGRLIPSYM